MAGVAIDSVEDMKVIFGHYILHIDIHKITKSKDYYMTDLMFLCRGFLRIFH